MKRKTLISAFGFVLLATSLLGCGGSNKLQTILLTVGGSGGLFNVKGIGGTLQLKVIGNYSNSKTHDLTNVATYSVTPDPLGIALPTPPLTVTMSKTGLMTAVEPAVCTWHDAEPDVKDNKPAWQLTGAYIVTASFQGVTSQQAFVAVASASGDGPSNACGP